MQFVLFFAALLVFFPSLFVSAFRPDIQGFLPQDFEPSLPRVSGLLEPCPSGCCPFADWFCCDDNKSCAMTVEDCPRVSLVEKEESEHDDFNDILVHETISRANLEPCPSG